MSGRLGSEGSFSKGLLSAIETGSYQKFPQARAGPYPLRTVSLDRAIDAYLDHLRVERALSKNTLSAYATDLAKLARFAEERGVTTPAGLDLSTVTGWLSALAK